MYGGSPKKQHSDLQETASGSHVSLRVSHGQHTGHTSLTAVEEIDYPHFPSASHRSATLVSSSQLNSYPMCIKQRIEVVRAVNWAKQPLDTGTQQCKLWRGAMQENATTPVIVSVMTPQQFVSGFNGSIPGCEWQGQALGCHYVVPRNDPRLHMRSGEAKFAQKE